MEINKKGIFFSLTALLIVGVLFLALTTPPARNNAEATFVQVQDITRDRDFLIEHNLPLILREHAIGSINRLAEQQANTGFMNSENDLNQELRKCLLTDQAVGGSNECGSRTITKEEGSMSSDLYELRLVYQEELQYYTTITLENFQLTQIGTWDLLATGTFDILIEDSGGIATYERNNVIITVRIPIEGLIDPLASSSLPEPRTIKKPNFIENPGQIIDWNVPLVYQHANYGSYVADKESPSYLMRLTGQNGRSDDGIQSLFPEGHYGAGQTSYVDFQPSDGGGCLVNLKLDPRAPAGADNLYLTQFYAFFYNITTSPDMLTAGCDRGADVTFPTP